MGGSEFVAWKAFLEVEPVADQRSDLHTAMLMALLANANRDRKKRPKIFELSEFMVDFLKRPDAPAPPSPAQLKAKFRALTKW